MLELILQERSDIKMYIYLLLISHDIYWFTLQNCYPSSCLWLLV